VLFSLKEKLSSVSVLPRLLIGQQVKNEAITVIIGLINKKKTNILLMGKLVMSISFTLLRLVFDSAFTIIYLRFEKIS